MVSKNNGARTRAKMDNAGKQKKKELGQYFTVSDELQSFVFDNVKHKDQRLLEPSFGAGHLLKKFKEYDPNYPMLCYEIDDTIPSIIPFNSYQTISYGDFTKQKLTQFFWTVVGNPPYVKQSSGNLYLKFIEQCYEALVPEGGELLFIVPSDFLKLTSASALLTKMTENGSFTTVFFPHDEKLFEGASIDVVAFRYEKGLLTNKTVVDGIEKVCSVQNGIVTFHDEDVKGCPIHDAFDVSVGLVSGRDEIYKVPFGNIDVLNDKGRVERYIFAETFPTQNTEINAHLEANKQELLARKIRTFSEKNWFEWGAPRNLTKMRAHWGNSCLYVRTMTRSKEVAFKGRVRYFGGTLLCLIPKKKMLQKELDAYVGYMNSEAFQKEYLYAGRFKIGHKQVSNAIVPSLSS